MELTGKLAHLVPHWIDHNISHAEQFEERATEARSAGLQAVAARLEAAGRLVRAANEELKQAQRGLPRRDDPHREPGLPQEGGL